MINRRAGGIAVGHEVFTGCPRERKKTAYGGEKGGGQLMDIRFYRVNDGGGALHNNISRTF